jgi:hypothetical protein
MLKLLGIDNVYKCDSYINCHNKILNKINAKFEHLLSWFRGSFGPHRIKAITPLHNNCWKPLEKGWYCADFLLSCKIVCTFYKYKIKACLCICYCFPIFYLFLLVLVRTYHYDLPFLLLFFNTLYIVLQ